MNRYSEPDKYESVRPRNVPRSAKVTVQFEARTGRMAYDWTYTIDNRLVTYRTYFKESSFEEEMYEIISGNGDRVMMINTTRIRR